ncbi:MAG: hypothetical protein ACLFQA_05220 [Bacteroidales bacterium]
MTNSVNKADELIKRYRNIWMGLENVNGIGKGKTKDGRYCIVISMVKDDPATRNIFPAEIEGLPVEVRISGEINAL